jgi:predicted  nucleic acid-binding Zn-ribbon protein
MSDIFPLYRLQQLDIQVEQALARQHKIETILKNDSTLLKAEEEERQTLAEARKAQRETKTLEAEAEAIKTKIATNAASLYGGKVRNPKELQDLQQESLSLQRQVSMVEEKLLDSMIITEELESKHQAALRHLEDVQSQTVQKTSLLRGEFGTLDDSLSRLAHERDSMIPSIDPEMVTHYENLRKKKGGIAVSRIENNTCASCGARLNAALIHQVRTEPRLNHCDGCGRILYAG